MDYYGREEKYPFILLSWALLTTGVKGHTDESQTGHPPAVVCAHPQVPVLYGSLFTAISHVPAAGHFLSDKLYCLFVQEPNAIDKDGSRLTDKATCIQRSEETLLGF